MVRLVIHGLMYHRKQRYVAPRSLRQIFYFSALIATANDFISSELGPACSSGGTSYTLGPYTVTGTQASTSPSSQVVPYTQSFPPAPTQNSGLTNQTVSVNDPRITTSGAGWNTTQSSCNSTEPSKKCSVSGETLTFKFTGQCNS
jgi:hypothetical protein